MINLSLDKEVYEIKKLKDICELNYSSYSKNENWDFFNYLDTKNIIKGKIIEIKFLNPNEDKIPSRAKRKVDNGDIIYSTVRPNQKHYGLIENKPPNFLVSTGFTTIKIDKKIAVPYFVYYYITQNDITEYLQTIAEQSTTSYPSIKTSDLGNIIIHLPPLNIQEKISVILKNINYKIKLNEKINSNLLKISYKLYEEWFLNFEFPNEDNKPYKSSSGEFKETSLGIIPKKWNVGFLEDLINFQNGYAFKSKDLLKKEETNCFHVFKMGHILKGGGLNHQGTKNWIKKSDCENLSKFILKKGDLLMSMTDMKGNVAILGHTALMDENDKYIVNQRVGLLRVSNNYDINYPYLYLLTNHNKFLKNLRGRANSGVQVNLSTKEIKQSKVVIPSKEINQKFDNIIKPIFDMIFSNNQEIIKLNNLIDILLPKLMNGSINISSVRF